MKLNLTQPFRTLNKKIIVEVKSKQDKGTPMILKGIVLDSLLGQCIGDGEPGGSEFRVKRFELAKRVSQVEDAIELSLDELGLIKKSIETRQPGLLPLFHGQALAMIEDKPTGLEE